MARGKKTRLRDRTDYGGAARRAATQGQNIVRKTPGKDVEKGFRGDLVGMGKDVRDELSGFPIVKESLAGFKDIRGGLSKLPIVKESLGIGRDVKKGIESLLSGFKFPSFMAIDAIKEGAARAAENRKIYGDAYTDELRESVMTPQDEEFYNKYIRLAASNPDRKEEYEKIAGTALQNQQITNRLNYGLGVIGADETPFEGYESYQPDFEGFEGETGPRFNLDNFMSGLEGTETGREFLKKHAIPKKGDTNAITKAIDDFYGGQSRLAEDLNIRIPPESVFESALPEEVTNITPPGFGEQLDYDELSGEFFPRKAYEQSGVFGRGNKPMTQEEFDFQMAISREMDEQREDRINAIDDFMPTPPRSNLSIPPIDERTGDARIAEDIAEWRRRIGGIDAFEPTPPGMNFDERINAIDAFEPTPPGMNPLINEEEENYPFKYLR